MMVQAIARRRVAGLVVAIAAVALTPAASASVSPTLTLDQSAGTAAASTANLGMDLKFAPSGSDSPKDLSLKLPAGLLANASIDGGACLRTQTPIAACQVGSGTATASPVVLGVPLPVPVAVPLKFYLVAPPKPGDLGGLVIQATLITTSQLGSPGDITVRPSSDPAGVGLNISFAGVPDMFPILNIAPSQIALDELATTFNGLRLPASCPATPANVTVTADSYSDATSKTVTAPLHVTGCSSLPFTPAFHVGVVKNAGDSGVQITTDITQPASPAQATSKTVALTLPPAVLEPNVLVVLHNGVLCANPASGTCKTVGTASSTSPLYPTPLIGKDYLTGSLIAPAITIVFPPPFALTLNGADDLNTSTTTFSNVPDIPLTDLNVTLAGGPNAVFQATCSPPSGTATSTLTSQSGNRAVVSSRFTVAGCTAAGGGGTSHSGSSTGTSGKNGPQIASASPSGLARGVPALRFKLVAGKHGAKLRAFTVKLPRGLSFVRHRVHGRLKVTGVSVKGAKIKSIALVHGRLVVTLRAPVRSLIVTIRPQALKESAGLKHEATRHQVSSLKLTVLVTSATGKHSTLTLRM
jgi:hypothetical protein